MRIAKCGTHRHWILVAALLAALSGPAAADGLQADLGGVQITRAQAAVAVSVTRHVLEAVASDASLKRMPTHLAVVHALSQRLREKWPLEMPAPEVFLENRRMQVFVTLYAPNGSDLAAEGRGGSLLEAVVDAAVGLSRSQGYRQGGFDRLSDVRVSFDLTVHQAPYVVNLAEPFLYSMRPGVDGLVYENGDQRGTVLPWEAVRRPLDLHYRKPEGEEVVQTRPARTAEDVRQAIFRVLLDRAGANLGTWRAPAARVWRFEVQSFVEDRPGGDGDLVAIYRTGPVIRPESLTDEEVRAAASLAAGYLARTPNRDQEVRDAYDPLRDTWVDAYDAPRQAMVAGTLARLRGAGGDDWMRRAALALTQDLAQGLQHATLKSPDGKERVCAYVPTKPDRAELVQTAQVLTGLCELQQALPEDRRLVVIQELANTMLLGQNASGSFNTYFAPATASDVAKGDREDVRGESLGLLALVRAYEATGRQELLVAARRTGEYLAFEREKALGRESPEGLADPYLVEALGLLDRHLVNDGFVEYAVRCADRLLGQQAADRSRSFMDELGGFVSGGASPDAEHTSFCLRALASLVGLTKAVEAESVERYRRLGLALARDRALGSIRRGQAYMLGLQYTPDTLFYLPKAEVASGGFRQTAFDGRISTVAVANFLLAEASK